jgi:ParB family chromosome partitioning protein
MSASMAKKKLVAAVTKIDLSGLKQFSVVDVMAGGLRAASGRPLELSLDDIAEDPDQARGEGNPGFSAESLAELAESIGESKGVKTPISVRSKNAEGKYLINHGARRYRASKLAGVKTIQAFIDDSHDDYDQAVENIQREAFTPMEIALFIQKRERAGDDRKTIAKRLGKNKAYVTFHAALLELPPALRAVYDSGRCQDTTLLYNLGNLAKEFPEEVSRFVGQASDITRSTFEVLKAQLREGRLQGESVDPGNSSSALPQLTTIEKGAADERSNVVGKRDGDANDSDPSASHSRKAEPQRQERTESQLRAKKAAVMVSHKEQLYVLRVDQAPSALHLGWIEDPATGKKTEVELADLRIDSIVSR